MSDANKYYLDKREAEQEEYDFKDEYEEIAADNVRLETKVEELEARLRDWETVYPQDEHKAEGSLYLEAADRIEELEAKLAEALNQLDSARHSVDVLEKRVAEMKG